jgi:uncharacterized protein (TIGR03437 family)
MPNQEITVTVTVTQADRQRYGFQATALDDQGRKAGDFVVTDANRTGTVEGTGQFVGRQYIRHLIAGVAPSGTNQGSWSFTWKAPAQSAGRVTFYVAGNGANMAAGNQGDYIYATSQSLQAAGALPVVSAASLTQTGSLAAESIASIFGAGLADGMATAPGMPLPTTLAGATVRVRDAAGMERNAPLFFAAPGQINFLIPRETGAGVATITIVRGGNTVGSSSITIEAIAPALFTANSNGQGVPAAVVFRRNAAGQDSYEAAVRLNTTTNRYEAAPIDLGPAGDQVFLIGFGSGFRNRMAANLSAVVGGESSALIDIGAQGQFEGLDQVNIPLPRALAGRGNVDVILNVNGRRANTVQINIR